MSKKRKQIVTNPLTQWLLDYTDEHDISLTELSVRAGLSAGSLRSLVKFPDRLPALEAQFRRRASQGKCVWQPYFGCREFPAYFELREPGAQGQEPLPWDADLGWMLYDVFDLSTPGTCHSQPRVSLFRATVRGGVLEVPDWASDAVRKAERREA